MQLSMPRAELTTPLPCSSCWASTASASLLRPMLKNPSADARAAQSFSSFSLQSLTSLPMSRSLAATACMMARSLSTQLGENTLLRHTPTRRMAPSWRRKVSALSMSPLWSTSRIFSMGYASRLSPSATSCRWKLRMRCNPFSMQWSSTSSALSFRQ